MTSSVVHSERHNQNTTSGFAAVWKPSDRVISDFPALVPPLVSASDSGNESEDLFDRVARAAEARFGGSTAVLTTSTASPVSHVYVGQTIDGLPILNTQLHVVVAKGSVVRATSSFVDFSSISTPVQAQAQQHLPAVEAALAVSTAFGAASDELLGPDFVSIVPGKSTLGFYLTEGGETAVKVWQFVSENGSVIANADSGAVLAYTSFVAN
ncbi:hypothetical protein HK100_001804 [Physocladia obscura]|uniref:FTP domain-containing protein n=1 Tax=Physocladia obscura TaxID=109957 RepID=A0AAD5XHA5_9FUNG|nr:hypothetical protein HK100_001804 [Physocladia obscura]